MRYTPLLAAALLSASAQRLDGIDVSVYQGAIDWKAVASSSVTFVSIKATESTTFHDPFFAANWRGAHAAGLIRTA
jgi:GH25 family lysozyme M1 (1,4-beta-N-acetylmuramidase)